MTILNYRPGDDQFWLGCTFEEAEAIMLPLMGHNDILKYHDLKREYRELSKDEHFLSGIRECYRIKDVPEAFFNISRDWEVCYCYPEIPLFPYAGQWNGYSPFEDCDHVEIRDLSELKQLEVTLDRKPFQNQKSSTKPFISDTHNTMSIDLIESILQELSEKRPIFWSEADFQFSFAWHLKEVLGKSVKIMLERRFEFSDKESDKYYVDIWVEYEGKVYPIELKYKTKKCESNGIKVITQSANDLGRYFYLWDIYRLEQLKRAVPNFAEGYAIMLTNDFNYYNKPVGNRSEIAIDHNFRIHERPADDALFPISSDIRWDISHITDSKKADNWTLKYPGFTLEKPFSVDWKRYKKLENCNIELKYLINVVNSTAPEVEKNN